MYSRKMSAATKAKISAAKKGKKHTQQTKDKISAAIKARWAEIPVDPQGEIILDVCFDEENNEIKKVFYNGEEIQVQN